jgi:predicted nucleotide-binding protein
MGELEELAQSAPPDEVLKKGVALMSDPSTLGGAIHLIRQLSRRERHSEAVQLAERLFEKRGAPRDLNILLSSVLASGDSPALKKVIRKVSDFVEGPRYEYEVQLITTWLRALLELDDRAEFWRVYNSYAKEADKTGNPFLVAQYYQMLIRQGEYSTLVEHYSQLSPEVREDDLLKKLLGRALYELGRIEEAQEVLRTTRNDYLRRGLEAKIADAQAAHGVQVKGVIEKEIQPGAVEQIRENRVFIVHGHDNATLAQVENLLYRIGAEPWVFHRLPKEGSPTVIEILERYIPQADAVIALLTPDDEGRKHGASEPLETRARQNVLIEAGYAVISKRRRSLLVALGGVSIPSDFDGIHRIQGQQWNSERELELAQRLKDMGLTVDPARAL